MSRSWIAVSVVLAALPALGGCGGGGGGGTATTPQQITVTLRNDTWEDGDQVVFLSSSFLSGEAIGATLGPAPDVMTLDRIRFRWGPPGEIGNFNLKVYPDTGAANPGTALVQVGRTLTPTADGWQEFDISTANILLGVGQSVRFVVEYLGNVAVGPARDIDGTNTSGHNWVYTGGNWIPSADLGITGDFIVRGIGVTTIP